MTPLAPTLTIRYLPNTLPRLRDLLLILAGSWLVALFAQIEFPLQPVPITGQTFAVLLVGAVLGGIDAIIFLQSVRKFFRNEMSY